MNFMKNKKLKNSEKSEKGSISLFVLIAILMFLFLILGYYIMIENQLVAQKEEINKISQDYQNKDIEEEYEKAINENMEE